MLAMVNEIPWEKFLSMMVSQPQKQDDNDVQINGRYFCRKEQRDPCRVTKSIGRNNHSHKMAKDGHCDQSLLVTATTNCLT